MPDGELSQHPTDRLIRALIDTARSATTAEIERIIARLAAAPFGEDMTPVPRAYRGLTYQGRVLGDREDPTLDHLVERVVVDGQ